MLFNFYLTGSIFYNKHVLFFQAKSLSSHLADPEPTRTSTPIPTDPPEQTQETNHTFTSDPAEPVGTKSHAQPRPAHYTAEETEPIRQNSHTDHTPHSPTPKTRTELVSHPQPTVLSKAHISSPLPTDTSRAVHSSPQSPTIVIQHPPAKPQPFPSSQLVSPFLSTAVSARVGFYPDQTPDPSPLPTSATISLPLPQQYHPPALQDHREPGWPSQAELPPNYPAQPWQSMSGPMPHAMMPPSMRCRYS